MSSFITLVLDTTSPTIEVFAPNDTTTETVTLYRIEANEPLSNIQNFYFRDSNGLRHDVTLQFFGTYFEGNISFSNFSDGMATFYAQVFDEVLNKSNLVQHNTNVVETREDHEVVTDVAKPREIRAKVIVRAKTETDLLPYNATTSIKNRTEMEVDILDGD
jgi:hypothetical protein